ncbi:hypothetical protein Javan290_0043 [Streptococcus phage Javan290]|uniref:DUF1642 domain-containing protein n=1 Tax=Streptococcus marmotae TaxID=1825069 RepID=UPI00082E316F|nr:DUF1642 domain-containing protein [Streptococcus marmotae]QBX16903.1 hypothetical protein Javan291_0027 [Streptococcus phage Javan291]QBX26097.1 hypothetical protein Javan290_0043 [Streptococcus phage Javan290]
MKQFKFGDKVRVLPQEERPDRWLGQMMQYQNGIGIVVNRKVPYCYVCFEDGSTWSYDEEQLELVTDELQKVKIPQFVADWIEECKIIYNLYGVMGRIHDNLVPEDILKWFVHNPTRTGDILARAWLDGYEIEQEKKYRVPLEGLVSANGQQYLSKGENHSDSFFACARDSILIQEFTLEEIPEHYREFAVEVEVDE